MTTQFSLTCDHLSIQDTAMPCAPQRLRLPPNRDILSDIRGNVMKMHLGKWGNSLAFRLPRKLVEELQLKEGDTIDSDRIKAAFREEQEGEIAARRKAAIESIGEGRFTLPADWKFDREEANWRPAMDRW